MSTFSFEIITPGRSWALPDARAVDVPAEEGRLTVLARHEPMICCLRSGRVRIERTGSAREVWEIGEGTLTVGRDRTVLLTRAGRPLSL